MIYRIRMDTDTKTIVRANILKLLAHKGGALRSGETGVTRLVKLGIPNGSAQRMLDESSDVYLSGLHRVAERLGVAVWQLCIDDLDPDSLPELSGVEGSWPFPMIDKARYLALTSDQRAWVQSKIDSAVTELETKNGRGNKAA